MKKMIAEYIYQTDRLIDYEANKRGLNFTDDERTSIKEKFKELMENSDYLWSLKPYGVVAYSYIDNLFTEAIKEYI